MKVSLKKARPIKLEERDVALNLNQNRWPAQGDFGEWEADTTAGLFHREITNRDPKGELARPLKERILRFPSAPIHGLHRLSQDHVNMGPVESFHTFRLLSHPTGKAPVSRIFLMHNGLNEIESMGLYYQLASHLIKNDPGTVCLVRPLPGHLTRCAYPGLSETPLDHYLWDGLHLFRQFLRYMIETRWLLSAIVRYSYYHCVSGSGLLKESRDLAKSRLQTEILAKAMTQEWRALLTASKAAVKRRGDHTPTLPEEVPPQTAFEQVIDSLRAALELDSREELDGSSYDPHAEPELHSIGYSLGGFAAQSVFMSWPFLISSCSTLLSGGAMRELAPTAFADPEEWQTVLHSLRYELDDAMLDWRFTQVKPSHEAGGDSKKIYYGAGIKPDLFLYLKRTFYEVFQQEYRGSFQTRLVSFRQRMLFVVGGNDPIVRPKSVLDSGPPDGINLLAVGGLGHFLGNRPETQVEKEQRAFWVPEIGRTIGNLAKKAADKHRSDLEDTWLDKRDRVPPAEVRKQQLEEKRIRNKEEKKEESSVGRLTIAERLQVERDGNLPNFLFQRALDDLLARATDKSEGPKSEGLLFVLKNEPPTFLLDEDTLQQHSSALYHEDVGIIECIEEVRSRSDLIKDNGTRERVCVVIPWNVEAIMRRIDVRLQHPSQSESSGEQMAKAKGRDPDKAWRGLRKQCKEWTKDPYMDAVRVFDGGRVVERSPDQRLKVADLEQAARGRLGIIDPSTFVDPALPDCWIWMSNRFLGAGEENTPTIEESEQALRKKVPPCVSKGKKAEEKIGELMASDDLRIVTASRARYNPRFRGRIVAKPRMAQELLLRASLCIVNSVPFPKFPFDQVKDMPVLPERQET